MPALRLVLRLGLANTSNFSEQSLLTKTRIFYLCYAVPAQCSVFVPELIANDKSMPAAFLMLVNLMVAMPFQLAFWYFFDRHNMHLFIMLESIKLHSPRVYSRINDLFKLVLLTLVSASFAVPTLFFAIDRPNMTHSIFGDQGSDPAWCASSPPCVAPNC